MARMLKHYVKFRCNSKGNAYDVLNIQGKLLGVIRKVKVGAHRRWCH